MCKMLECYLNLVRRLVCDHQWAVHFLGNMNMWLRQRQRREMCLKQVNSYAKDEYCRKMLGLTFGSGFWKMMACIAISANMRR